MPEYTAWANMKKRCNNPNHPQWNNYGGRGIKVCERWNLFDNFLKDMGRKPNPSFTLERRDNDLGYFPENCLWASRLDQTINRRVTSRITIDGVTKCLKHWCQHFGIDHSVVQHRIKSRHWAVDRALKEPVNYHRQNWECLMVTLDGKTQSVGDWCRERGLKYSTVYCRVRSRGWDMDKAINTPV